MASMFDVRIDRKVSSEKGVLGDMFVNGEFVCHTLELPWRNNQSDVSCVPKGTYPGYLRYDHRDRWRIELMNTGPRTHVQIHIGNTTKDIKGCVAVGTTYNTKSFALDKSADAYKRLERAFYLLADPSGGVDFAFVPRATPAAAIVVRIEGVVG